MNTSFYMKSGISISIWKLKIFGKIHQNVAIRSLQKKWAEEEKSYITALDSDGDENEGYFTQDIEMDAYAYAFAVMKYKYGEIKYLYVPDIYKNGGFNNIVGEWIEFLRDQRL